MKLLKVFLIGALVLVLLLVAGVVGVFVAIDSLTRSAVERAGTYALGVDTTLGGADVRLLGGGLTLDDLSVANPEGYDDPRFLNLGQASMSVDLGSLRSDTVRVPLFELTDARVVLERADGKANYEVILENLKRLQGTDPGPGEPGPEDPDAKKQGFVIDRVVIRNVRASVEWLDTGAELTKTEVVVPEIVLTDVGGDGKPVSAEELTSILVRAIFASIINAGQQLPGKLIADLQSGMLDISRLGAGDLAIQIGDLSLKVSEQTLSALLSGEAADLVEQGASQLRERAEDEVRKGRDRIEGRVNDGLRNLLGPRRDQPVEQEPSEVEDSEKPARDVQDGGSGSGSGRD